MIIRIFCDCIMGKYYYVRKTKSLLINYFFESFNFCVIICIMKFNIILLVYNFIIFFKFFVIFIN